MVKNVTVSIFAGINWSAFSIGFSVDRKSLTLDLAFAWLRLEW